MVNVMPKQILTGRYWEDGMLKFVSRSKPYNNRIKRILDLAVAVTSVIILSPLLMLIAFMVRMRIGSPALFRQARPGHHGKPFTIYKFRTMTDDRDGDENLLPDADRLTPFGRCLRSTSIDELP